MPGLARPVKQWANAGFVFNFICATISQLVVDGPVPAGFFPIIILALTVVYYIPYFREYRDYRIVVAR